MNVSYLDTTRHGSFDALLIPETLLTYSDLVGYILKLCPFVLSSEQNRKLISGTPVIRSQSVFRTVVINSSTSYLVEFSRFNFDPN